MNDTVDSRNALPISYRLENYLIQSVLGDGSFGITYLAKDIQLNTLVVIKEYLPNELAVRNIESHSVQAKSQRDAAHFSWGLDRFVKEAQILAQFKHPNIVRVLRFFNANNTAYTVMEYEVGQSLASFLREGDTATEEELMRFLPALLEGLETIHKAGYLHRDIKPTNIYLRRKDYSPILIDFGAARYDLGNRSRSLTTIITPGYAAFEQYQNDMNLQGPWTDIYASAAVFYRLISGFVPPEATERVAAIMRNTADPLVPIAEIGQGQYSQHLLEAIDWGLAIDEQNRPHNIEAWCYKLFNKPPLDVVEDEPPFIEPSSEEANEPPQDQSFLERDDSSRIQPTLEHNEFSKTQSVEYPDNHLNAYSSPSRNTRWVQRFAIVGGIVILLGGAWLFFYQDEIPSQTTSDQITEQTHDKGTITTTQFTSPPPIVEPTDTLAEQARHEQERAEQAKREYEARLRAAAKEKAVAAQAQIPSGSLRIIKGAGVRLRQEPRWNARKNAIFQIGSIVFELEKDEQQGQAWYQVKTLDGNVGWVSEKYALFFDQKQRAQTYIKVTHLKLNDRRASFGDFVDLYHFLSRVSDEVELETAVELKLLRLLTLQASLEKIPANQQNSPSYSHWLDQHKANIIYNESKKGFVVKRALFQQMYDKYNFLLIAERILQEIPE